MLPQKRVVGGDDTTTDPGMSRKIRISDLGVYSRTKKTPAGCWGRG